MLYRELTVVAVVVVELRIKVVVEVAKTCTGTVYGSSRSRLKVLLEKPRT